MYENNFSYSLNKYIFNRPMYQYTKAIVYMNILFHINLY